MQKFWNYENQRSPSMSDIERKNERPGTATVRIYSCLTSQVASPLFPKLGDHRIDMTEQTHELGTIQDRTKTTSRPRATY